MKAESLIDNVFGFIRDIIEQIDENPFFPLLLSKKRDILNAYVPNFRYMPIILRRSSANGSI